MKRVVPLTRSGAAEETATSGAEDRLAELLGRYSGFLRRTILRVCPRAMGLSCDDIEQEARLRLWSALKNETEIAYPGSYIYKVAVSATLRAIRQAKARREDQLDELGVVNGPPPETFQASPEASPEAIAERRECIRKIDAALQQLRKNRRLAVGLHLQGMTTREIGELLGWSEAKARNLVHRGLTDLRRHLRSAGIEYGA